MKISLLIITVVVRFWLFCFLILKYSINYCAPRRILYVQFNCIFRWSRCDKGLRNHFKKNDILFGNKTYLILSYLISSHLISSHLISSHLISHLISSYLILSYLILSCVLSYLVLSYLILPYLLLSYLNISYLNLTLTYLIWHIFF